MFDSQHEENQEIDIILENSKTLFKQTVTILLRLEFPNKYKDKCIFEEDEEKSDHENKNENPGSKPFSEKQAKKSINMVGKIIQCHSSPFQFN